MQSNLTLIGLYNYVPDLFENFTMPEGIDADIAKNEILFRSGEFELLYPNPDFMKFSISQWCSKHYRTFEKWIEALNIAYDPLNNYDRKEEYTDSRSGNRAEKRSDVENHTDSETHSDNEVSNISGNNSNTGTNHKSENSTAQSGSNTTGSSSPAMITDTVTTSVAAFDSSSLQDKEKTVTGHVLNIAASDSSSITSNAVTSNGTDETTSTSGNMAQNTANSRSGNNERSGNNVRNGSTDQTENEVIKHSAHLWGNIGVQMSQSMLQAELDVQRFNVYEQIADLFVDEFCIMVY